ncbi:hypothetical protein [Streptomyces sp. BE133]|uniref:hypothetical protein n=1 Tax=Streptomyces sp. BE133 TaxID=3002523 RepID=UPI002E76D2E4|nr:hypothetical protein [Streptomyces sp. BE133]MEE1807002.1 hypothetical protein [Streptomyces sp. BE133]
MAAAIRAGATSADVVAVETRKAAALVSEPAEDSDEEAEPPPWAEPSGVVSLTVRRVQLPEDKRPLPTVSHYHQLPKRQPKGTA